MRPSRHRPRKGIIAASALVLLIFGAVGMSVLHGAADPRRDGQAMGY